MSFSNQPIIVDAKDHLLGRLAAVVAKNILQGQRVVVLRCERINISGNFYRNKLKYLSWLHKRCNVKPLRGPFHHRAPSKLFYKAVKGMVKHNTKRGREALGRLKVFEGIPPTYAMKKRKVVPSAMRVNCLKSRRKYCRLGRISHEIGWKYQDVVETLEAKRKVKGSVYHKNKLQEQKLRKQAFQKAMGKIKQYQAEIEKLGYN